MEGVDHPTAPTERARWFVLLPVLAAFLAAIVSFVGSSLYADHQAAAIHTDAVSIADDAAPSIARLSAARSDLHRFQALMADYVNDAVLGRPIDRTEVDRAREELDRDLQRYLALPIYPGEHEAWNVVSIDLAQLDEITSRVMRFVAAGDVQEANAIADASLREAINRTSDAIAATIDINARQAQEMALAIEQSRGRSHRIAMALDALSVALALLAGGVAVGFVLRYLMLSRDHARYVERRADELEQFAGRVAHDVLGPLTSVALALDLTGRRVGDDPAAQAVLGRGRNGIARTRAIVDGLLSFAKAGAAPEPGARAEVAAVLHGVMEEIAPVAREAGVELTVGAFPTVAVRCSPGVLTSIVSNLVRNAIKYIGNGATRRIEVRIAAAGAHVRFEIEDTGPGIAPGLQHAIFEPYVRAPGSGQAGLGLGLATVKRLVEAHAGRVGLRSAIGAGSTFWFELPASGASESASDERHGPGWPLGGRLHPSS